MSKIKVSTEALKEHYNNIIVAGYCDLQDLLSYEEPTYYNCGLYGWNFDGYIVDNDTIIITGYRNLNGNYRNYELTRKYNEFAKQIKQNYYHKAFSFEECKSKLQKLIKEYCEEMINCS